MNNNAGSISLPIPHLAEQFLLDKNITFLNHGSYGACPKPVFSAYQKWQRELERNPVDFIGRKLPDLLRMARGELANFVGTDGDNITFVPNATHGINIVVRSLNLQAGDEVLSTDHEYGAINNTWRFNCEKWGAKFIEQPIAVPIEDEQQVVEQLWAGVTEHTKVITISHITSPTALTFPVEEICQRARKAGIITVVDGAHTLGQIDLDMEKIGADYYVSNAHKWLSSGKGAAFLYVRPECQNELEPLVVSHGWHRPNSENSQLWDYFSWTGTDDPAAYLSVTAAIEFQEQNNWSEVRQACHSLNLEAQNRILELSDKYPLSPDSMWAQMGVTPISGAVEDYHEIWDKYQIIVPILEWNGHTLVRTSIQAYNTPDDVNRLVDALAELSGFS